MKRIDMLLAFAFSLIAVISLFLIGNHNSQLPSYVKHSIPQTIHQSIINSTGFIEEFPNHIYSLLNESANMFEVGSVAFIDLMQVRVNEDAALCMLAVKPITDAYTALNDGINYGINQTMAQVIESQQLTMNYAAELGQRTFIELPEILENQLLKPTYSQISYAFIQTRNYTRDEIATPISYDLLGTKTSLASEQ